MSKIRIQSIDEQSLLSPGLNVNAAIFVPSPSKTNSKVLNQECNFMELKSVQDTVKQELNENGQFEPTNEPNSLLQCARNNVHDRHSKVTRRYNQNRDRIISQGEEIVRHTERKSTVNNANNFDINYNKNQQCKQYKREQFRIANSNPNSSNFLKIHNSSIVDKTFGTRYIHKTSKSEDESFQQYCEEFNINDKKSDKEVAYKNNHYNKNRKKYEFPASSIPLNKIENNSDVNYSERSRDKSFDKQYPHYNIQSNSTNKQIISIENNVHLEPHALQSCQTNENWRKSEDNPTLTDEDKWNAAWNREPDITLKPVYTDVDNSENKNIQKQYSKYDKHSNSENEQIIKNLDVSDNTQSYSRRYQRYNKKFNRFQKKHETFPASSRAPTRNENNCNDYSGNKRVNNNQKQCRENDKHNMFQNNEVVSVLQQFEQFENAIRDITPIKLAEDSHQISKNDNDETPKNRLDMNTHTKYGTKTNNEYIETSKSHDLSVIDSSGNRRKNYLAEKTNNQDRKNIFYKDKKNINRRSSYPDKKLNENQNSFNEKTLRRSDPSNFNSKFLNLKRENSKFPYPKICGPLNNTTEISSGFIDEEYDCFNEEYTHDNIDCIKVNEITKDLFEMSDEYSLAHCVAEDFRMGEGIAVLFKEHFKQVDELVKQSKKPGELAHLEEKLENGTRYIYYLVTKKVSSGKPTYETFWSSLKEMRSHIEEKKVQKLAIPRLGCGLDRLHWDKVKMMIEFLFKDVEIEIIVCNFHKELQNISDENWD